MKKNYLVLKEGGFRGWFESRDIFVGEEEHVYTHAGNVVSGDYLLVEVTDFQRDVMKKGYIRVTVVEPPESYWGVFYHAPTALKECVGVFRVNTTSTTLRARNVAIEDFARRFGPNDETVGRIITINQASYAQYTLEAISREEYDKYVEQDVLVERTA